MSDTRFKPGQSGNPTGGSKKAQALRELCAKAVDEHVVQKWINEVVTEGPMWLKASELLAAYGYGKPTQHIEHGGSLTLEQLVAGSYEKG